MKVQTLMFVSCFNSREEREVSGLEGCSRDRKAVDMPPPQRGRGGGDVIILGYGMEGEGWEGGGGEQARFLQDRGWPLKSMG